MCGYPCSCGCDLFDIRWNEGDAVPDGITAIAGGWYRINKSVPGKNWSLKFDTAHDHTSNPAGDSRLIDLDFRVVDRDDIEITSGTIKREIYGKEHTHDERQHAAFFDLSITKPDSLSAKVIPQNPSALVLSDAVSLEIQFEDSATLLQGSATSIIHDWASNSLWPDDVQGDAVPGEYQAYVIEKVARTVYLSGATDQHSLTVEFRPSWVETGIDGSFKIAATRIKNRETGHRGDCGLVLGCTLNTPSHSSPRWTINRLTLPSGNHTYSQEGADQISGGVGNANERYASTDEMPAVRYSQIGCVVEESKTFRSHLSNTSEDWKEPFVAYVADPPGAGDYAWQGGGTFNIRPWVSPESQIRILEDESSPGKRLVAGWIQAHYFPTYSTSTSNTYSDSFGWLFWSVEGKADVVETDRRKYFQSVLGDWTPAAAPVGVTTGNRYAVWFYQNQPTYRTLKLHYRKEVNTWTGSPPTIEFTGADLLEYEIDGAGPYPPANLAPLSGINHYLTQVETTPSGDLSYDGSHVTSDGQLQVDETATLIDFDDFSIEWVADPDALPHPS